MVFDRQLAEKTLDKTMKRFKKFIRASYKYKTVNQNFETFHWTEGGDANLIFSKGGFQLSWGIAPSNHSPNPKESTFAYHNMKTQHKTKGYWKWGWRKIDELEGEKEPLVVIMKCCQGQQAWLYRRSSPSAQRRARASSRSVLKCSTPFPR